MESLDKKYIQKVRMVKYFVDATIEIIEKEGYEAVTIRKVADIAGYNSATLYNYFDNLEHLLFFCIYALSSRLYRSITNLYKKCK